MKNPKTPNSKTPKPTLSQITSSPNNKHTKKNRTKALSVGVSLDKRRLFSSPTQMEAYLDGFVGRKLVEPKWMDLSFFAEEGFQFQQLLHSQGLTTFASLNCNYLTELIKVFYSNLNMLDGDLITEVKKTPIRITPSDWLAVTGLNHEGAKLSVSKWEGYDRTTAVKGILKDPSVIPSKIMAGRLNVEDRMLHYSFVRILIPRGSNYAQLVEEDIFVLWAMKQGIMINWPCYISNHMMKVKKRHMMDLPYAFLVTKFLLHFGIDTVNEGEVVTTGFNKFGWTAINHMKLKKVNGVWITTGEPVEAVQVAGEEEEEEEMPLALAPALAAAPPNEIFNLLVAQMQDLRNFVGKRFDHLDSCVASLDARLKALEDRDRDRDEH